MTEKGGDRETSGKVSIDVPCHQIVEQAPSLEPYEVWTAEGGCPT